MGTLPTFLSPKELTQNSVDISEGIEFGSIFEIEIDPDCTLITIPSLSPHASMQKHSMCILFSAGNAYFLYGEAGSTMTVGVVPGDRDEEHENEELFHHFTDKGNQAKVSTKNVAAGLAIVKNYLFISADT